jgi:hypothetical protein
MSRLRLILRWAGALLVAVLVHFSVIELGVLIWQHFGTDIIRTLEWTVYIATLMAVLVGAIVAPRGQRKVVALTIWMLFVAYFLWFVIKNALSGHFSSAALSDFTVVFIGGIIVYYPFSGLMAFLDRRAR